MPRIQSHPELHPGRLVGTNREVESRQAKCADDDQETLDPHSDEHAKAAIDAVREEAAALDDLIRYLESNNGDGIDINTIQAYRERYGIQD